MARLAYYRCSTSEQSIEHQRVAMGGGFDKEFIDEGISGGVCAADRPGFSMLLSFAREGDSAHFYAVDRLGRDALDVQATVRDLLARGVSVEIHGLGQIGQGPGELILAVLAQVADMERKRIAERCQSGRRAAVEALRTTGRTHRGKLALGRSKTMDPAVVAKWRRENSASISETAKHFSLSVPTVKRYCALASKERAVSQAA